MDDKGTHDSGTRKGEEFAGGPGRQGHEGHPDEHVPGRTARDATGINAEKRGPIDPSMPEMPPS
jgi:hypothetical protein